MLVVPGMGRSYPFNIANNVHFGVHVSSLRGFYYVRCGEAITAANGGTWARAAGHITQDAAVQVNYDAATTLRPTGTLLSCEKGWYDAGDYNKYAVNAGISTYTLMALYEHYSAYYDTLNLNIPESTNSIGDLLDQVIWEIRWLLTQQDPNDGGVYNKTTNLAFDGFIMPAAATNTRYVVAKGTTATFDFAAVMAVASRILMKYNTTLLPGLADSCLNAANSAWIWGRKNPNVQFNNPANVSTGGYNDTQLMDEQEWAAMELYITTKRDSFYTATSFLTEPYWVPEWDTVRTLGIISLVQNRKNLTAIADTTAINNLLLGVANTLRATAASSAYRVAMGARAGYPGDFVWGSNGQAANEGFVLMQAYRLTGNISYWDAAIDNLDYLNGRNATTYCFLTGSGSNSPMNIHHRPSASDGIVAPVPGLTSGGPQNFNHGGDGGAYPTPSYPATEYVDNVNSFSTNEIAINWNAPYAYLSGAAEVLNPCEGLIVAPVELMNFTAIGKNANVTLNWQTAMEINNNYFEIQRSADSRTFNAIGRVNGNGNSKEILNYSFDDNNPLEGISYYRLKQVDYNGRYTYSGTLPVSLASGLVTIYPNPATNNIIVKSQEELLSITLIDVTGRTIFMQNVEGGEAMQQIALPLTIQKGLYLISVQTKTQTVVQKLILQ